MLGFQRDNIPLAGFGAAPHRPPSEAKCKGKAAQGRRASHAPYQPKTGFQRDNIPLAGFGAAPHRPPSSQQKKQRQSRPRAASKSSPVKNPRLPNNKRGFWFVAIVSRARCANDYGTINRVRYFCVSIAASYASKNSGQLQVPQALTVSSPIISCIRSPLSSAISRLLVSPEPTDALS